MYWLYVGPKGKQIQVMTNVLDYVSKIILLPLIQYSLYIMSYNSYKD